MSKDDTQLNVLCLFAVAITEITAYRIYRDLLVRRLNRSISRTHRILFHRLLVAGPVSPWLDNQGVGVYRRVLSPGTNATGNFMFPLVALGQATGTKTPRPGYPLALPRNTLPGRSRVSKEPPSDSTESLDSPPPRESPFGK